MKRLFVGADGLVRGGWVVACFSALATVFISVLSVPAFIARVEPPSNLDQLSTLFFTWPTFVGAVGASALCWLFFKDAPMLPIHDAPARFVMGCGLGAAALTVSVVVPAVVTGEGVHFSARPWSAIALAGLMQVLTIAPTSVGEELLLRGVAFRAFARATSLPVAVGVSSLVFGALHLMNPGSSWAAVVNVALVGVWFGAATWLTGSLWTSIGMHVAWNWCEGFVFGAPVSGIQPGTSLLVVHAASARGFWSGGTFGPEASGWTSLVLISGVVVLVWARDQLSRR